MGGKCFLLCNCSHSTVAVIVTLHFSRTLNLILFPLHQLFCASPCSFFPFSLPMLLQNHCTLPVLPVFCAPSLLLLFSSDCFLLCKLFLSFLAALSLLLSFSSFPFLSILVFSHFSPPASHLSTIFPFSSFYLFLPLLSPS